MRIEKLTTTSEYQDVTMDELIEDFLDYGYLPSEDLESDIDEYLSVNVTNITDEEAELFSDKVREINQEYLNDAKEDESNKLKDRDSILEVIENIIMYDVYKGEVGYYLTAEEILDLILENGRK